MPVSPLSIRFGAAFAALFVSVCATGKPAGESLQSYFKDYDYCALILSRNRYDETMTEAGTQQCQQALSPCSTFKIPNALIGLQTGVVSGPDHVKQWDGTERSRKVSNQDHSMQTAITESIPWYFQDLARDVGEQPMASWLARLDYGNQDISGGIDRFWLGSSLKINAHEQLGIIKGLWHGSLPFKPDYQAAVRDMLIQESDLNGVLHGKTGSCRGDGEQSQPDHGWFIGWVDWRQVSRRDPATTFFVINISGSDAWGSEARTIALQILQDLQAGPASKHSTEK
jgi:beta-lactamase class D